MKQTVVFSYLFLLLQFQGTAQLSALQRKAVIVKRMVELNHYSPRVVDDRFSENLFRSVLDKLDQRRLYFTEKEYNELKAYELTLDDELQGKNWVYLERLELLYKKALLRADSNINSILQKPFDYSADERLMQTKKGSQFIFAQDNKALNNRWARYLKYLTLSEVYEAWSSEKNQKRSFAEAVTGQEQKMREKIKKAELKNIHRELNYPSGLAAKISEVYLDAVAAGFDPHTNYFTLEGKEQFQEEMSSEAYTFGMYFTQDEDGKIIIDKLTPGGPAWKSGELNKGDELLSLLWEGNEVQDMEGATLEEVYSVLNMAVQGRMIFRFRKKDGTITNAMLRKEKADNEENIVKSFILNGKTKIGYILLPGFYTGWENETGSRCASDVAKEILKLKKENIDGLVIDLRYNGGGSLGEAIEMTGLFVDEGPLVIQKDRSGKLLTHKDPNRGTIYDGPLALMVNGQSASASEIFSGALQDYNRAIIIGSNTYGKATMQELFLTDTLSRKEVTGGEKGDVVKITTAKLYRITGKTAQQIGVKPDIELPDAFDGLEIGERFENAPLIADSVKKNNYYKPLPFLPVNELAGKSKARVSANENFQVIRRINAEFQQQMQETTRTIPLKATLFEKWIQQQSNDIMVMKGEGKEEAGFSVSNHAFDKLLINNDDYAKELNNEMLDSLTHDIYVQEVYKILLDLIDLQKTSLKTNNKP